MRQKLYFGGIPVAPDLRKLVEAFGSPEPGLIDYERIESVLGITRERTRFRTVVTSWRRHLLGEENVYTAAIPGEGIKILTEQERTEAVERLQGRASKTQRRVLLHAVRIRVEMLDALYRARVDHLRIQAARAASVASEASRAVKAFKAEPPTQAPRVPPKRITS